MICDVITPNAALTQQHSTLPSTKTKCIVIALYQNRYERKLRNDNVFASELLVITNVTHAWLTDRVMIVWLIAPTYRKKRPKPLATSQLRTRARRRTFCELFCTLCTRDQFGVERTKVFLRRTCFGDRSEFDAIVRRTLRKRATPVRASCVTLRDEQWSVRKLFEWHFDLQQWEEKKRKRTREKRTLS